MLRDTEGVGSCGSADDLGAGGLENFPDHPQRVRIVINHENANAQQVRDQNRTSSRVRRPRIETCSGGACRRHEREDHAGSRAVSLALALSLDRAAVHFDDVPRDRQAEAETSAFARRS